MEELKGFTAALFMIGILFISLAGILWATVDMIKLVSGE